MRLMPPRSDTNRYSVQRTASKDWRARQDDYDEHDYSAGEEDARAPAPTAAFMSEQLLRDNVSYALQARLAFSPYFEECSSTSGSAPGSMPVPEPSSAEGGSCSSSSTPSLSAARVVLERVVLQRLRELQLLAEWPLLLPPLQPQQQQERPGAGGAGSGAVT
ncbi:hypothetical protein Agub_g11622, partial [Astrephomene gubernaculifera]